jgi:hypothetical protein
MVTTLSRAKLCKSGTNNISSGQEQAQGKDQELIKILETKKKLKN